MPRPISPNSYEKVKVALRAAPQTLNTLNQVTRLTYKTLRVILQYYIERGLAVELKTPRGMWWWSGEVEKVIEEARKRRDRADAKVGGELQGKEKGSR